MPGEPRTSVRIRSTATALPEHVVGQDELLAAFRELWGQQHFNQDRLEQLFRAVCVGTRHLALPVDEYRALESFSARNAAWTRVATRLADEVLRRALDRAGLRPDQLDAIFFTTVTGIATPSIDARLVELTRLRPDVKRTPIFGLGCVAGAAGIARATDALRGYPGQTAALVAVELCSLTLQREDLSVPNLIASGLFGDGAACVILANEPAGSGEGESWSGPAGSGPKGNRGPPAGAAAVLRGPEVAATRSVFYPGTERVMGWDIVDSGFKIVLSSQVPQLVRERIRGDVDAFLGANGLRRSDVRHWICHSGGPKVLEAFEEALELPRAAVQRTWDSLQAVGNLSSASVLFVLADLLASDEPRPGDVGLLLAMGPGFCSELVLLRW